MDRPRSQPPLPAFGVILFMLGAVVALEAVVPVEARLRVMAGVGRGTEPPVRPSWSVVHGDGGV